MRKAMIVLLSIAGYWVVCMCLAGCAVLKVEDATMQSQPVWGEYEEGQMFIFEDVFEMCIRDRNGAASGSRARRAAKPRRSEREAEAQCEAGA